MLPSIELTSLYVIRIPACPVVGLEMLSRIREEIGDIPLVAIGGINAGNLREVFAAGADSAAMISAIVCDADSITSSFEELIAHGRTIV